MSRALEIYTLPQVNSTKLLELKLVLELPFIVQGVCHSVDIAIYIVCKIYYNLPEDKKTISF